ncbi:hypothetical protein [Bifidobacterium miconisargentati]|uniref:hypothetical protein n=1 Tax=Bifidobacterium miconisargentati TaxID=2834437 RepID=UPI001BDBFB02|nr:hypothetical protein [Bifidobacterium miconisargentati]MBW3089615.1 hypothetical protein [Bifidobacterium miconisargentati]
MSSKNDTPGKGCTRMFPMIATASSVALAGQISPKMAWLTYVAVLIYAAVNDRINMKG